MTKAAKKPEPEIYPTLGDKLRSERHNGRRICRVCWSTNGHHPKWCKKEVRDSLNRR